MDNYNKKRLTNARQAHVVRVRARVAAVADAPRHVRARDRVVRAAVAERARAARRVSVSQALWKRIDKPQIPGYSNPILEPSLEKVPHHVYHIVTLSQLLPPSGARRSSYPNTHTVSSSLLLRGHMPPRHSCDYLLYQAIPASFSLLYQVKD